MKKNRKIKWGNVIMAILFIVSSLYVLSGAITLATSLASITLYGAINGILALVVINFTGEYLYEQMQ